MCDDTPPPAGQGRIQFLDALRGLSILLMIAYHCGYDLVAMGRLPEGVLYNPFLNVLNVLFAGLFIVIAGISSEFSRNNLKRGLLVLGAAVLVTLVSLALHTPVWFGILHLMASCILLYALLARLRFVMPFVLLAAFLAAFFGVSYFPVVESADYFPILPWGFLFFLGVFLGKPIREGRFPAWFYVFRVPFLPVVGRHTLVIYLLHQPALYGILYLFR